MTKTWLTATTAAAAVLLCAGALAADPSSFPGGGFDARSLGRGGTGVATPPGPSSVLGNPATLTATGIFSLGADYVRSRDTSKGTWALSLVDTASSVRGALAYFTNPEFADFEKNLWGVAFAQSLTPYLTIGESFHMGEYEPDAAPGEEKSLSGADLGFLLKMGGHISLGYVARNVYRSDSDLLEDSSAFGVSLDLPWTILFTADYEETPLTDDHDLRAGVEFKPFKAVTARLGYQDLAGGTVYYSVGLSYSDPYGTVDAAILYNEETEKTDRVVIGVTMGM
ncbi:MAG: hypothetical protein JSV00_09890 [bacterium]|nr:MAG: hypothetical protein JSV00_09890 [bacterium]